MKMPIIVGIIKRRFFINFRIDPDVLENILPEPFSPRIHNGYGIGGVCLIRLERMRPKNFPSFVGVSSENAGHRFAVEWKNDKGRHTGVFIPRRDTNSLFNHWAGGKIFPGVYQNASFLVNEEGNYYQFLMKSKDEKVNLSFSGQISTEFPKTSCFFSLEEVTNFMKEDSLGYSATNNENYYDGITLHTLNWNIKSFIVDKVVSSYFMDESIFPKGSVTFDHAFIMRNIEHEWLPADRLEVKLEQTCGCLT